MVVLRAQTMVSIQYIHLQFSRLTTMPPKSGPSVGPGYVNRNVLLPNRETTYQEVAPVDTNRICRLAHSVRTCH